MEKSFPFKSINGDRKYKTEDFTSYFASFIGNGIFPNPSTNLQVIANNNMTVTIRQGKAFIEGQEYTNTSDLILSVEPADGVLNRIDRIVIRVDYLNRIANAKIKKGVFASTPTAPTLQRDADAYEIALADISISKGAISINQANITDLRLNKDLCGIVHGVVEQIDLTTLFNQYTEGFKLKEQGFTAEFNTWFNTVKNILGGDVAGNLLSLINNNTADINNIKSQLADNTYSTYKLNQDVNGIFTEVQHKRKDGTLICKSVLSGTSPNYSTRTETWYKSDGVTVDNIKVFALTYNANGDVISEVMQ